MLDERAKRDAAQATVDFLIEATRAVPDEQLLADLAEVEPEKVARVLLEAVKLLDWLQEELRNARLGLAKSVVH